MLLLLETGIIILYLVNGYLGFIAMLLTSVFILLNKNNNVYQKLLLLLLMSLPMSYIGIIGVTSNHIFSWYNLFLLAFIYKIITNKNKFLISKKNIIYLSIIIILLCLNIPFASSIINSIKEIIQILLMLIPIMILFDNKDKLSMEKKNVNRLIFNYATICLATAIGMLFQYFIYANTKDILGFINFSGGGRISCYCLFKGASILPIYLGIGFLIQLIDILNNKVRLSKILSMLIIFIAMVLNSSRTALAALIVICGFIMITKVIKKPTIKTFIIGGLLLVCGIVGIKYIVSLRVNLNSFLDANGRFETWINGVAIWLKNIKNLFLGIGFDTGVWVDVAKPHNMVIQSLAQCGIIFTLIAIILIVKFIFYNRKNRYIPLIYFVILSGMLVTDFYANAFTTMLFILVCLYSIKDTKKNRVKVLHYIPGFKEGGIESRLIDWYQNMDRSKVEFSIIKLNEINNSEKLKTLMDLGGKYYNIVPFNLKNFFTYIIQLNRVIKKVDPDIIHVHSLSTGLFALMIARNNDIKIRILHSRTTNYLPNEKNVKVKKILKSLTSLYATDYFACSKDAGRWGIGKKYNVKVINNGITLNKFAFNKEIRKEYRQMIGMSDDDIIVGTLGRLSPQKNLLFLIDIFDVLKKENNNYKLVIVGEGSMREKIEDKIHHLNLEDFVFLLGSKNDVWNYYMAFDLFVCTSLYEGFGTTAIEAQATGLPSFVSDGFPTEVLLTDYIQRISLDETTQYWAKQIEKTSIRKRNKKDIDCIEKSGYSAKNVAKELETFYANKVKEVIYEKV